MLHSLLPGTINHHLPLPFGDCIHSYPSSLTSPLADAGDNEINDLKNALTYRVVLIGRFDGATIFITTDTSCWSVGILH